MKYIGKNIHGIQMFFWGQDFPKVKKQENNRIPFVLSQREQSWNWEWFADAPSVSVASEGS